MQNSKINNTNCLKNKTNSCLCYKKKFSFSKSVEFRLLILFDAALETALNEKLLTLPYK